MSFKISEDRLRELIREALILEIKDDSKVGSSGDSGAASGTSGEDGKGSGKGLSKKVSETSGDGGNVIMKFDVGNSPKLVYFYPGIGYGTNPYVKRIIKGLSLGGNLIIILAKNNSTSFSRLEATAKKALGGKSPSSIRLGGWSGGGTGLTDAMKSGKSFGKVIYADPTPTRLLKLSSHGNAIMYYNPSNWKGKTKALGEKQKELATKMGSRAKLVRSDHNDILKSSLKELVS